MRKGNIFRPRKRYVAAKWVFASFAVVATTLMIVPGTAPRTEGATTPTLTLSYAPPGVAQVDCAHFDNRAEAQAFMRESGPGDPYRLDADHDGRACNTSP